MKMRGRVPPKEVRLKALGVEALEPGEVSLKIRARVPEEAAGLIEELTPKERGRALMLGLEALGLWQKEEGLR